MATCTNYGYTATARRLVTTTPSAFSAMALGSGSQADAVASTVTTLVSEITASGLSRTTNCATIQWGSTGTASDTVVFINTWTCTAGTLASGVAECGVFGGTNTHDTGDMLCYGTFAGPISMVSGDTLQVTWYSIKDMPYRAVMLCVKLANSVKAKIYDYANTELNLMKRFIIKCVETMYELPKNLGKDIVRTSRKLEELNRNDLALSCC